MTTWTILALAAVGLPFFVLALGYTSCSGDCCPPLPDPPEVTALPGPLTLRVEIAPPEGPELELSEHRVRWYLERGPVGPDPSGEISLSTEIAGLPGATAEFTVELSGRWTVRVEAPIIDLALEAGAFGREEIEVYRTAFDIEPGTVVDPRIQVLVPYALGDPDRGFRRLIGWRREFR